MESSRGRNVGLDSAARHPQQQAALASGRRKRGDFHKRGSLLRQLLAAEHDAAEFYDGRPASDRRGSQAAGQYHEGSDGKDEKTASNRAYRRIESTGVK